MRDLIVKTSTSLDHKKRQLSFRETIADKGVCSKIEKKLGYKIIKVAPLIQIEDLKQWVRMQAGSDDPPALKCLSIFRKHDSKTGEDKFEYNATGDLFIIHQDNIFVIEFSYILSVDSVSAPSRR